MDKITTEELREKLRNGRNARILYDNIIFYTDAIEQAIVSNGIKIRKNCEAKSSIVSFDVRPIFNDDDLIISVELDYELEVIYGEAFLSLEPTMALTYHGEYLLSWGQLQRLSGRFN